MSYKLFIPGPVAVSEKTLLAMAQGMVGHRSPDFVALYNAIQPDLPRVEGSVLQGELIAKNEQGVFHEAYGK